MNYFYNQTKSGCMSSKSKIRSIHSSLAIEANSLSLFDVENILDNKQVLGKKDEVQEVKNAIEAYNHINDYNYKSEKDLLKLHQLMMRYFDEDNGSYRNHGEGVKKMMAELFGTTRNNITIHLSNIFEKELSENSVCKEFLHTARDGKNYKTKYYNLDIIIAVGFKVNSKRAIDFSLWTINILKQYSVKGYVLNKERFKNGTFLKKKYRITQDKLFANNVIDFDKFMIEMENENISC